MTRSATPDLVMLSTVEPEEIEWLSPGRIPRGAITILAGDPGLGKTTILLDLAARESTGRPWPGIGGDVRPAGGVVLLSCEDALAQVIRPRLDALGADVERIASLRGVCEPGKRRAVSLATDLPAIEECIARVQATIVIIDPLSSYLGANVNAWRDDDVRRVMDPLAALAERTRVAVVGLAHLNKATDRAALYRSQGSIAFVASARSVLALSVDPADPDHKTRRVLTHVKSNLGVMTDALELDVAPPLTWIGERRLSAHDALAPRRSAPRDRPSKQDAARDVIRELLAAGPMRASTAKLAVHAHTGASDRTIDAARDAAGVDLIRPTTKGGEWLWALRAFETSRIATSDARSEVSQRRSSATLTASLLDDLSADSAEASQVSQRTIARRPSQREPGEDDPDATGWPGQA